MDILCTQGLYTYVHIMYMMRPKIPEVLENKIETAVKEAGYNNKTEFVNDAVRRRLEELDE